MSEIEETTASSVYAFARDQVFSTLARRYENREFSRDLWRRMGELGLFGYLLPPAYGGNGQGPAALMDAAEAFVGGGRDLGLALAWLDHLLIHARIIERFGTEGQKETYLPALARGERIGAFAASEPGIGANPARMQTRAEMRNGEYRITGRKIFITNGPIADVVIVLARTGPGAGKEGISAFLVESSTPGFRCEAAMELGFLETAPHGELVFDDCVVPAGNMVGRLGEGHIRISRAVFAWERFILALGLAAHFRVFFDRVMDRLATGDGTQSEDASRQVALLHIELEALRETANKLGREVLERTELDERLLERLLFLGNSLSRWWEGMNTFLGESEDLSAFPLPILVKDAGLLYVARGLQRLQLKRIGERVFAQARARGDIAVTFFNAKTPRRKDAKKKDTVPL